MSRMIEITSRKKKEIVAGHGNRKKCRVMSMSSIKIRMTFVRAIYDRRVRSLQQ